MGKIRKKKIFIRLYLLYLLPILLFLIGLSLYLFQRDLHNKIDSLKKEELASLKLKESLILFSMEMIEADFQVLTASEELEEYFNNKSRAALDRLKSEYLVFAQKKSIYDQIRVLDIEGNEVIRIDYTGGNAVIVDDLQLQNKADRYYFRETIKLGKGEMYISPMDLNVENGIIEVPYKPMIRFGTPYFINNEKKYVIILNFKAKQILDYINQSYFDLTGERMLLNSEGYWLLADDKDLEWGFMFPGKKNTIFSNKYPGAWNTISNNTAGQMETDEGIFTFITIDYACCKDSNYLNTAVTPPEIKWKLVSFISDSTLKEVASPIFWQRIFVGAMFLLGAAVALAFIANLRTKNLVAKDKIEEQVVYLTKRDRIKNKFMAIFSHDLKNALGALREYAKMLKEDYDEMDDSEKINFIESMEEISNNSVNLLLTLLEWARSSVAFDKSARSQINLYEIIDRNIGLLKLEAKTKKIKLESSVDFNLEVLADGNVIDAVLRNFIFNAIKFTQEGGMIKIYTEMCNDDKLNIVVEDNGIGMTEEQIKKVLDPDEKYTTRGTREESGSGMGLTLCKELIENNNGELKIESEPGKGSKFCFSF